MGKFTDEIVFICDCHSSEHQMIFELWKSTSHEFSDEDNFIGVSIHLVRQKFFKRLWLGIKYIFGYTSKFGNFDYFIFQPEDADKLQRVVDQLKQLEVIQNNNQYEEQFQ